MNRGPLAFFTILLLGAAVAGTPALAQYAPLPHRGGAPPIESEDVPSPGYWLDDDGGYDLRALRRVPAPQYRQRSAQSGMVPSRSLPGSQEADAALPPPGFAVPADRLNPDLGSQTAPATQQPDVIRPPAPVGMVPQTADRPGGPVTTAALPPEDQPEIGEPKQLPKQFKRQLVDYQTSEPAGTLVIDTDHTFLYLVLGDGKAVRYGIGVGREGFTWSGTERVSKMAEWPDWHPPSEMIERQPYLPRFMAGGPGNPLGARALYLGKTLYRIHGTNQPSTIGSYVSSGCIRLLNADIEDLYARVQVGSRVVVLPSVKPPPPTDLTAPNTGPAIISTPLAPPIASDARAQR
jgi:lipoprotein-anchoring transpeptidase ErfK/SrfK